MPNLPAENPAAETGRCTVTGQQATVRSMMWAAFVPQGLFSVGLGAITPIIPLTATDLGASVAAAALVVTLIGFGQLLADAPAGTLTVRFGERPVMVAAATVSALALVGALLAPNLWAFGAAIFVIGAANAVWLLARITFVADRMPYRLRARAMSTLGGSQRIGFFVGPFLGAGAIQLAGTRGAYGLALVATFAAAVVLLAAREPAITDETADLKAPSGYRTMLVAQRRLFATVGLGIALVNTVRASRQVVLPLWGEHIGLDPAAVSLVFGASTAIEIVLFYPAGRLMDLRGRASAAVASMVGLAIGHMVLPLTSTVFWLTLVAVILGIGNGIGSGLVMTLGADFAPPGQRAMFFGIWRLISDVGNGAGPFLLAGVTAVASLGIGAIAMGGVGVVAAAAMAHWVPRRVPHREGS